MSALSRDLPEADDISDSLKDKPRELDALSTGLLEEVGAETRRSDT